MKGDRNSLDIDSALSRLAADQYGLVTVRQAWLLGIDRHALSRRRRSGFLVPVRTGVMRVASVSPSEIEHALASALAVPGSIIAGPPAGAAHGLPVGRVPSPVLLVSHDRLPRVPGAVVIRSKASWPSRPWAGSRLATPSATLVTLARFLAPAVLERCLDHGIAHRLTTAAAVRSLVESLAPQCVPGRATLLDLLDERGGNPRHRSSLEQKVARWLDRAGLDGWRPNEAIPVIGGTTIEADFAWLPHRAILEVSPFFTHGARAAQERDAERRRLLVESGWRVVEATDVHLGDPFAFETCVDSLRRLGVGRRPGDP